MREKTVNLGCETSRESGGEASGSREAGRIWEEGGKKGQGEVRGENSAQGLGGERGPSASAEGRLAPALLSSRAS